MKEETDFVNSVTDILFTANVIQLLTATASLFAVLVGLGTLVFQYKSFQKQRKPVIRAIRKEFNTRLPSYHRDWETDNHIDTAFSESLITLANYGGSASHVENYTYRFLNRDSIENEFAKIATEDLFLKLEDKEDLYWFDIVVKWKYGPHRRVYLERGLRYGKMINVNEEMQLPLPSFFMVLSNFILSERVEVPLPELKLIVRYSDLDLKFREQEYIVKWESNKSVKQTTEGTYFTGALSAELIKDRRGRREKSDFWFELKLRIKSFTNKTFKKYYKK